VCSMIGTYGDPAFNVHFNLPAAFNVYPPEKS